MFLGPEICRSGFFTGTCVHLFFFEKYSEKVDIGILVLFSKFSCEGVYETRNFDHHIFQILFQI